MKLKDSTIEFKLHAKSDSFKTWSFVAKSKQNR